MIKIIQTVLHNFGLGLASWTFRSNSYPTCILNISYSTLLTCLVRKTIPCFYTQYYTCSKHFCYPSRPQNETSKHQLWFFHGIRHEGLITPRGGSWIETIQTFHYYYLLLFKLIMPIQNCAQHNNIKVNYNQYYWWLPRLYHVFWRQKWKSEQSEKASKALSKANNRNFCQASIKCKEKKCWLHKFAISI